MERLLGSPLGEVSLEPPGDGSGGEERRPVVRTYGCSGLEVLLGVRRSGTWFFGKDRQGRKRVRKKGGKREQEPDDSHSMWEETLRGCKVGRREASCCKLTQRKVQGAPSLGVLRTGQARAPGIRVGGSEPLLAGRPSV